jgi:hypothetical protein
LLPCAESLQFHSTLYHCTRAGSAMPFNRDSPDGLRIERNSASIRFPLQGEAVALADRRVVTHGRGPFCAKSNDFSVILPVPMGHR